MPNILMNFHKYDDMQECSKNIPEYYNLRILEQYLNKWNRMDQIKFENPCIC